MKRLLLSLLITSSLAINGQNTIHINVAEKHQTIRGIGASDAWNVDPVGKYWSNAVKEDLAQKLFSTANSPNGQPLGIGLSRWRFNIGGGSLEQGDASNIDQPERRAELFLNADGTYDWSKQAGQQWFLNKAKEHGVEHLVAFVNSPPRFYTKSGRANSNDYGGSTNLKAEHFEDYVQFLVEVLKHFDQEGLPFSQISPLNEPQYPWLEGQEGTPWTNEEIKELTGKLNAALLDQNLDVQILLAEAESYRVLYEDNTKYNQTDNQINSFFDPASALYLGHLGQLSPGIAAHAYWTDTSDEEIIKVRKNAAARAAEKGIELYQTEYCLLSNDYDNYLSNAIFLGKMIHADLAIAGVSIYDYWTALERERWSQKNRFYLIRLQPTGGDYGSLEEGGTITVNKNLWVLGNFSRFIRPGYQRVATGNAENLSGVMSSAYLAPDHSKLVVVHVNWGTQAAAVQHQLYGLPQGKRVKQITPYVTDAYNNLTIKTVLAGSETYTLSGQSVTTMVIDLEEGTGQEEPQPQTQVLLSGEKTAEPIVYHDFVEWTKTEADKVPAWYIQQAENTYTTWTANPDAAGINTSAYSLMAETKTSVDWWGNFWAFRLATPLTITAKNRYLHLLHYRTQQNYGWSIHLNTDGPYEDASQYLGTLRFDGDNLNENEWEDLVIDLNHLKENNLPLEKFMLIVDKAWFGEKNSLPARYYFDEIILSDSPFARTTTTALASKPISDQVRLSNPAPGQLTIDMPDLIKTEIWDATGRLVLSKSHKQGPTESTYTLPGRGLYLVRTTNRNKEVFHTKTLVF